MTALIGGSVLLILIAAATLVMGWAGTNEPLIYTSITSSVASFVCLALAYYRSKSEARRVVAAARAAESPDVEAGQEASAGSVGDLVTWGSVGEGTQEIARIEPEPETEDEASIEVAGEVVVAFAQRRKYHRPACRYAQAAGGERLQKTVADARGYDACRVCKP